MDILILGGTNFLGPHLVEAAQARGHRLTLFNRGTRDFFPNVEKIRGDRNSDLALLRSPLGHRDRYQRLHSTQRAPIR